MFFLKVLSVLLLESTALLNSKFLWSNFIMFVLPVELLCIMTFIKFINGLLVCFKSVEMQIFHNV